MCIIYKQNNINKTISTAKHVQNFVNFCKMAMLRIRLNITVRPIKSSWIYGIFLTSSWFSQHSLQRSRPKWQNSEMQHHNTILLLTTEYDNVQQHIQAHTHEFVAVAGNFVLIISGCLWFRSIMAQFGAAFALSDTFGWFRYFKIQKLTSHCQQLRLPIEVKKFCAYLN